MEPQARDILDKAMAFLKQTDEGIRDNPLLDIVENNHTFKVCVNLAIAKTQQEMDIPITSKNEHLWDLASAVIQLTTEALKEAALAAGQD